MEKLTSLQEISDALNCNLSSLRYSCFLEINYRKTFNETVCIYFSLDKKDTWVNDIYQNSRYVTVLIFDNKDNTFTFEPCSSNAWETPILKLRKKTTTKDKMIKHITDLYKNMATHI